ncbi:hypothetical protein U1Q18_025380 [Sarracenia purpurea var. burkii]
MKGENSYSYHLDSDTQSNTTFSEKTSAKARTDERSQLSTIANLEVRDTIVGTEDDKMHDINTDESVIVVIQTAVRGFLSQGEMLKLKYVVKLQAAVWGHLVRRQAAGTLRCAQAIVKMQALVRARRARLSSPGSGVEEKLDENHAKDNHSSKVMFYLGQQRSLGWSLLMFKCLSGDHTPIINLIRHSLSN